MQPYNQDNTRRISQVLAACLAVLALLSPLSVQCANGQVTLTIKILISAVVDDPAVPAEPPTPEVSTTSSSSEPAVATEPATEAATATEVNSVTTTESVDQPPATSASEPATPTAAEVVEIIEVTPSPPAEQPLSVGPSRPLIPEDRPNWITLEPDYTTDTHRFVVSSIPTARESDVDSNLDAPLEEALRTYVSEQFKDGHAGSLLSDRLSAAFIRTNLVDDKLSYTAELSTTSGGMFQKWVMVEVSAEQLEQIQTWYREQVQRERIVPLGVGVAGLLGFVGLMNILFRKAAGRTPSQPIQLAIVEPAVKKSCCGKKSKLGFVVAIAIAIAVAVFAG